MTNGESAVRSTAKQFHITFAATTFTRRPFGGSGFCELLNDAPKAALNDSFSRGRRRKSMSVSKTVE